jgi:hypothetical protein
VRAARQPVRDRDHPDVQARVARPRVYEETGLPRYGQGKDPIKILTALSAFVAEASCLRTFMGFNTKI